MWWSTEHDTENSTERHAFYYNLNANFVYACVQTGVQTHRRGSLLNGTEQTKIAQNNIDDDDDNNNDNDDNDATVLSNFLVNFFCATLFVA